MGPICPEFFVGLSESTGMQCPYCGFPCRCSAAMFAKML
jgi:DNA-directed RNA polymerase subunit RPC12/RpoP